MQVYEIKLQNGTTVHLTHNDMYVIHNRYLELRIEEYVRENYPEISDESMKAVVCETLDYIDNEGYEEEEALALAINSLAGRN